MENVLQKHQAVMRFYVKTISFKLCIVIVMFPRFPLIIHFFYNFYSMKKEYKIEMTLKLYIVFFVSVKLKFKFQLQFYLKFLWNTLFFREIEWFPAIMENNHDFVEQYWDRKYFAKTLYLHSDFSHKLRGNSSLKYIF